MEQIPSMPSYRQLHPEHFEHFQELVEPQGEMKDYWQKLFDRYRAIPLTEKPKKAELLADAIQEIPDRFTEGGEVVLRRVYYHLGHTLERIASFDLDDGDDLEERGRVFYSAAQCYITADEIFGFWSGYGERAVNCLGGAGLLDQAQDLAQQIWGENTIVVPEGSPDEIEVRALMKRSQEQRIDAHGNRIYDIYLPPADLN
jgi:hypothetical protein